MVFFLYNWQWNIQVISIFVPSECSLLKTNIFIWSFKSNIFYILSILINMNRGERERRTQSQDISFVKKKNPDAHKLTDPMKLPKGLFSIVSSLFIKTLYLRQKRFCTSVWVSYLGKLSLPF